VTNQNQGYRDSRWLVLDVELMPSNARSARLRRPLPESGAHVSEDVVRIVRRCPLFQGLAVEDLREVLHAAQQQRVKKGAFYFQQGDRATTVHVLIRGRVKQVRVGSSGRQVILRFIHPSEPFGFDALFDPAVRRVAAQAAEDSYGVAWDVVTLTRLLMMYPAISLNSLHLVVKRLVEVWDRLWDLSTAQVERRIARALLRLKPLASPPVKRGSAFDLAVSHQDLADLVGTTPYTVSRILRRWNRLGIVMGRRKVIRILWPHRLAAIAEDEWPVIPPQEYLP
jgi:CRP/FNR family transcriptional regulator, nitrogen oxide reductase regulator